MNSNTTLNEYLKSLYLSSDPKIQEIANNLYELDVSTPEELSESFYDDEDVECEKVNTAKDTVEIIDYLRDDPKWIESKVKGYKYWLTLGAFNESNHYASQNVSLICDNSGWMLIVNAGFKYNGKTCEHYHGETGGEHDIDAKNIIQAKQKAIEILIEEYVSKNMLHIC